MYFLFHVKDRVTEEGKQRGGSSINWAQMATTAGASYGSLFWIQGPQELESPSTGLPGQQAASWIRGEAMGIRTGIHMQCSPSYQPQLCHVVKGVTNRQRQTSASTLIGHANTVFYPLLLTTTSLLQAHRKVRHYCIFQHGRNGRKGTERMEEGNVFLSTKVQ